MAKHPFTVAAVTVVVVGLALPAVAAGQAIPRTTSTGGGTVSTGSSSSGSSGTSSGSSGSTVSTGSSSSGHSGSSGSSGSSGDTGGVSAPSRGHGGSIGDIAEHSVFGGVRGRASLTPPAPGGRATAVSSVAPVNANAERRTGVAGVDEALQFSSSLSRPRGDNPISGFAAPRSFPAFGGGGGGSDDVSFPFWGPWGQWYPWYSGGFGYGFGYYGYSPWYYGATCWGWGRWGAWYDPFGYCWNPYFGAPSAYVEISGGGGGGYKSAKVEPATGKLRIITSPKTANVYIDDALVGSIDEFDGLSDHLELDKGRHVLSVRAEGYEAAVQDVVVEGGKTVTVRLSMKKVK